MQFMSVWGGEGMGESILHLGGGGGKGRRVAGPRLYLHGESVPSPESLPLCLYDTITKESLSLLWNAHPAPRGEDVEARD